MNLVREEEAVALVEFSLLLPLLAFLFVGIVDYAMEIQQSLQIQEAASAGAAFGAIPGNQKSFTGMQTAAQNAATGVNGFSATAANVFTCTPGGTAVTSATTCAGYGTPIEYVQVKTTATIPVYLSFVGMPSNLILQGFASYRVPWTP